MSFTLESLLFSICLPYNMKILSCFKRKWVACPTTKLKVFLSENAIFWILLIGTFIKPFEEHLPNCWLYRTNQIFLQMFCRTKRQQVISYLEADSRFLTQISFKFLNKLNKHQSEDPVNNAERNWSKDANHSDCRLICFNLVLPLCCVGAKLMTPQGCPPLTAGTCGYAPLHGKRTWCLEIGMTFWIILVGPV